MLSKEISKLRENYTLNELLEENVAKNPIEQFENWFNDALDAHLPEPNAMTLSTTKLNGGVASRVVLLKDVSHEGFTFFTNYQSNKGAEMLSNHLVALNFNWLDLQRQVRIEGVVSKLSEKDSEAYFASRPRGSQLGAWISLQSKPILNRAELDKRAAEITEEFLNKNIPKPPNWGGYIVVPSMIEFWQGRPSRLHDRLVFTKCDETWSLERLMP